MANKITFTSIDKAIVDALRNAPDGLTLAEINAVSGVEVKPGHIVSAAKPAKNLVAVIGERTEYRPAKSKVSVYKFVTDEQLKTFDEKWDVWYSVWTKDAEVDSNEYEISDYRLRCAFRR